MCPSPGSSESHHRCCRYQTRPRGPSLMPSHRFPEHLVCCRNVLLAAKCPTLFGRKKLCGTTRCSKHSTDVSDRDVSIARQSQRKGQRHRDDRAARDEPTHSVRWKFWLCLPVCHKDLEGGDEVSKRSALVVQPLLVGVDIVHKDKEVVLLSLVVDLGLGGFSSSHFGCGLKS